MTAGDGEKNSSGMFASSGRRFPLRVLHERQAVTTLVHSWRPPRDTGTICSTVRSDSLPCIPQYAQTWRSRANRRYLLSPTCPRLGLRWRPRIMTMELLTTQDRSPETSWSPPVMAKRESPRSCTTLPEA